MGQSEPLGRPIKATWYEPRRRDVNRGRSRKAVDRVPSDGALLDDRKRARPRRRHEVGLAPGARGLAPRAAFASAAPERRRRSGRRRTSRAGARRATCPRQGAPRSPAGSRGQTAVSRSRARPGGPAAAGTPRVPPEQDQRAAEGPVRRGRRSPMSLPAERRASRARRAQVGAAIHEDGRGHEGRLRPASSTQGLLSAIDAMPGSSAYPRFGRRDDRRG